MKISPHSLFQADFPPLFQDLFHHLIASKHADNAAPITLRR
jgi:hypothetical protein